TSVLVHCEGSSKLSEHRLSEIAEKVFDLTPGGIIEKLKLRRPIYKDTARYGHFGRKGEAFTWEKTDMVEAIKKEAGLREPALGRV
ncbi:MAG: methionine adenosyltransferase domain-containing protein, partial [Candidatus Brocadiales bacterium]